MTCHSDSPPQTCTVCFTTKPADNFPKRGGGRAGTRRDCKACVLARKKKWNHLNRDRTAAYSRKYNHGISSEDYNSNLLKQGEKCAVCKEGCSTGRRLAVDHDHDTGITRGLLCFPCNVSLGKLKDSPAILASALRYLHAHGKALSTEEVDTLTRDLHQ